MSLVALSSPHQLLKHVARLAIVSLWASLVLTTAGAQDGVAEPEPRRSAPSEAIDHYQRGREHYQAGRYEEAVVELELALSLDPDSPNLVYNLARVYELLGTIDRSIGYYERYYGMLPAAEVEERERVAGTIQRLEGARRQPAREPPPKTVKVVVPTERGVADGSFWTLATLSFAALAAGAVTGGLAIRSEHQTRHFVLGRDGTIAARNAKADLTDKLALVSDISVATGAIGGLTSILLYALRSRPVVAPSLSLMQHGMTLSLRGEL